MDQGLGTPLAPGKLQDGVTSRSILKVAVLLPEGCDVRKVRRAAALAGALLSSKPADGQGVEVAIGLPEMKDRLWEATEQRIRDHVPQAIVRHLSWTRVPAENAMRMFANLPDSLELEGIEEVSVPRDWGWNFTDCDCWISLASPETGAILPLKPIIHYVADLAERYVPAAVAKSIHDAYWQRQVEAFRMWRQGVACASDPDTVEDLVSYAGVRRSRIELVPDVLDRLPPLEPLDEARDGADEVQPTLLWLQRGNALDELECALQGLAGYLREGGTLTVVRVVDGSRGVAKHPQAKGLQSDLSALWSRLPFRVYRSAAELDRMLARADALWSSQVAGGEGEHVHDARRAGLPLIAPAFALNRRQVERLSVAASLYELGDPLAITDALHALERSLARSRGGAGSSPSASRLAQEQAGFGFLLDRALEQIHAR